MSDPSRLFYMRVLTDAGGTLSLSVLLEYSLKLHHLLPSTINSQHIAHELLINLTHSYNMDIVDISCEKFVVAVSACRKRAFADDSSEHVAKKARYAFAAVN